MHTIVGGNLSTTSSIDIPFHQIHITTTPSKTSFKIELHSYRQLRQSARITVPASTYLSKLQTTTLQKQAISPNQSKMSAQKQQAADNLGLLRQNRE